jgi:uncharacterized metal-binding protein
VKVILRPIPVVFACRGCELDAAAQRAAARFERRGEAETGVMGKDAAKARSRYPIYVIEGCGKCCATKWLESLGVQPQRGYILDPLKSGSEPELQLDD